MNDQLNAAAEKLMDRLNQLNVKLKLDVDFDLLKDDCSDPSIQFGTSGIEICVLYKDGGDSQIGYVVNQVVPFPGSLERETPPEAIINDLSSFIDNEDEAILFAAQAYVKQLILDLFSEEKEDNYYSSLAEADLYRE